MTTLKNDLVIAVTGLNAGENPQPGVPVIRALRNAGFQGKIIGLVYDAYESGIFAHNLADEVYLIPFPSAGTDALMSRLMTIMDKTKIDVLIPTLDSELLPFISLENRLKQMGVKMYLPTRDQFMLRDKSNLSDFCKKYKIRTPAAMVINNLSQIDKVTKTLDMPVMVKGRFYEAHKAFNTDEIEKQFKSISAKWGLPIIVQEYLQGEEYNVVMIGNGKGEIIAAVPIKKVIVTEKGKGFAAVVIQEPKLMQFARSIIKSLSWRGPLELEILKAQSDDKYYLLEINPRLPAWILLTTGAGQNFPLTLVQLALGQTVKPIKKYDVGKLFIRHSEDIILDISTVGQLMSTGALHNLRTKKD